MNSNIIFCFTGTGNSLKAAKDISLHLSDCLIVSMVNENIKYLHNSVQKIGFIFPVYYLGIPSQVKDFIENIQISNSVPYIFSIATCGRFHGNSIRELNGILKRKGTQLSYGNYVQMGDNAIVLYNAKGSNPQIEQRYNSQITNIIQDIKNTKHVPAKKELGIVNFYHNIRIKKAGSTDIGYQISNSCLSCGKCKMICPAKNIEMIRGFPSFQHRCQQCMACIQLCPQNAINYKNRTQKRQRYHNPNISIQDLIYLQNNDLKI